MISKDYAVDINAAARLLRDGKLVAFPTETVYGLGADASNPAAVRRIFNFKGRPANHPLIVHLADTEHLEDWACDIPSMAWRLAERFWPGPLTLILPKAAKVPPVVTGGQNTIGLRVPAHPLALELLKTFGGGVAAPSANRFGRISPTCADHVREEFEEQVELVLDGGDCLVGLESTIISLIDKRPILLRPGGISASEIAEVLGTHLEHPASAPSAIRTPGLLLSHYAPFTPLEVQPAEALWARAKTLRDAGKQAAIMAFSACSPGEFSPQDPHTVIMPSEPVSYAKKLYTTMRTLDRGCFNTLLVETPPNTEAWSAIINRLHRAAFPNKKPRRNIR